MTATNRNFKLSDILKNLKALDPDIRFMGASDLVQETSRDDFQPFQVDKECEQLVSSVLDLLADATGDVRGRSVECAARLLTAVPVAHAAKLAASLASSVLTGAESLQDVSALALVQGLKSIRPGWEHTRLVVSTISETLMPGLRSTAGASETQHHTLVILMELLSLYGGVIAATLHAQLVGDLRALLGATRSTVRKNAITAIGFLTWHLSAENFAALMDSLLGELRAQRNARTVILALAEIIAAVGTRFGPYAPAAVPLIMQNLLPPSDTSNDTARVETSEAVFGFLCVFMRRCPVESAEFDDAVVAAATSLVGYDPNFQGGGDDDDGADGSDGSDQESDGGDVSDDEDSSWKLRKAAVRVLATLITCRPRALPRFSDGVALTLARRFRERESGVKADVFTAFGALLHAVSVASGTASAAAAAAASDPAAAVAMMVISPRSAAHSVHGDPHTLATQLSWDMPETPLAGAGSGGAFGAVFAPATLWYEFLAKQLPSICAAIVRELKAKTSAASSKAVVALLIKLSEVVPGVLAEQFETLIGPVLSTLDADDLDLKLAVFAFLRDFVPSVRNPAALAAHVGLVLKRLTALVRAPSFRVNAEALRLIGHLAPTLAAASPDSASALFATAKEKLAAADSDQEVKRGALKAIGALVAKSGAGLSAANRAEAVQLLLAAVGNAIPEVRAAAIKALYLGLSAPAPVIDIRAGAEGLVVAMTPFLRRAHKQLQQASLLLLKLLARDYPAAVSEATWSAVLLAAIELISDNSLLLASLALELTALATLAVPNQIGVTAAPLVAQSKAMLATGLAQGQVLHNLAVALATIVSREAINGDALIEDLKTTATASALAAAAAAPEQTTFVALPFIATARVIAHLAVKTSADRGAGTVQRLLSQLSSAKAAPSQTEVFLGLRIIGEIGAMTPLDAQAAPLQAFIVRCFDADAEVLKMAAAFAYGSLAAGAIDAFLPEILKGVAKRQFLTLVTLKELIEKLSVATAGRAVVDALWRLLLEQTNTPEVGTRFIVAECIGRLAAGSVELTGQMGGMLARQQPEHMRLVGTSAVRFALGGDAEVMEMLARTMYTVVELLADPALDVRRATSHTVNHVLQRRPALVLPLLDARFFALLTGETLIKDEYITELQLGMRKVKQDAAEENRKVAFATMGTILDASPDLIHNPSEFIGTVAVGLKDTRYDTGALCASLLTRCVAKLSAAVFELLLTPESLLKPVGDAAVHAISGKVSAAIADDHAARRKAVIVLIRAMTALPGADALGHLTALVATVKSNPVSGPVWAEVAAAASA